MGTDKMQADSTPHVPGNGANQAGSFLIDTKPSLTSEQQVGRMKRRALIVENESKAITKLAGIS